MTLFREWLLAVTAAAMLVALACAMIPEGAIRKIGRLTGGLLLLLVILHPLDNMDYAVLSRSLSQIRGDLRGYEGVPQTGNYTLMKSIIEARSAAYIIDKAAQMGIVCQAEVLCRAEGEDWYPCPVSVTVTGMLNDAQRERLSRMIEADLAIPAQAQSYQLEGGETP